MGKKPSLKVHINTTSDSILLKFLRPNPNVKLEGFLLGYGSNVSPNQYFPLPTEGKFTEAVVDAEPKYLIVVRPAPPPSQKKSCSGKSRPRKPLQLVVGTLTPSSVFLSWGFLINPHHDWTLPSHCPNDRFYTIRYREKDKEKKWIFQLCPATETIVDNLKPNTVYEFGVKDNIEGGIWSKIFNHKTIVGSKNKVNGKIQSTYDQVHSVPAYVPRKLIPITIIKQVIQNVTHRASTKSPDKTPFGGTILVHLIIPGLNDSTVKLPTAIMLEISDALKAQLAKNETLALPAESKTPEVEKVAGQPVTVTPETVSRSTKPTLPSTLDTAETALVLSEKTSEAARSVLIPEFEFPLSTLAPKRFPEFPEAKTAFLSEKPGGSLASSEESWAVPESKTSEDSRVVQPQTATYDVISSSTTSDETEIEPHAATSMQIMPSESMSKVLRDLTLTETASWGGVFILPAPSEAAFESRNAEIFTSPEARPTTAGTVCSSANYLYPFHTQTTVNTQTAKSQTWTPEPEIRPSAQSTKAPRKTKRPGHRLRPKTTRSPEVPKSKPGKCEHSGFRLPQMQLLVCLLPPTPNSQALGNNVVALEPATVAPEILVPTIVPKPPQRPKTTRQPEVPQIKPAPKPSRPRTHHQHPKHKTTPSPKLPQTKPASTTKKVHHPRPKLQTTPHPEIPQTILEFPNCLNNQAIHIPDIKPQRVLQHLRQNWVPTPVFEPVTPLKEDPVATIDLERVPDLETPVAFRTEAPRTTPASKVSQRTRRPQQRPKATLRPQAPPTKPAPKKSERKHRPRPKPRPIPRPEAPESKPAPKTPKRTRRPRPKPQTTPTPEVPLTKPAAATDLEPSALSTEVPATMVLATALAPVTLRTKAPKTTTLVPSVQRTRRPRLRPKTTASTDVSESKSATPELQTLVLQPVTSPSLEITQSRSAPAETDYVDITTKEPLRPEEPRTEGVVDSLTHVSELPETTLATIETSPLSSQTIILADQTSLKLAPSQTPSTPPKLKTPHSRMPAKEPVPKGSLHTTSVPPSPEVADTTSEPQRGEILTEQQVWLWRVFPKDERLSHKPDTEVSHSETVLPPVTFRVEPPKTTIAPLETRGIPLIPVISPRPSQEELQTTKEEAEQSTQEPFTTKIPRTTQLARTTQAKVLPRAPHRLHTTPVRPRIPDRPRGRPAQAFPQQLKPFWSFRPSSTVILAILKVPTKKSHSQKCDLCECISRTLNKTTTRPDKAKPRGTAHKNGAGTGTKQVPKPPSTGRNASVDAHAARKPGLVPGTRRPPVPHRHTSPRPASPQRKPLPPNNVTGKPGSAGIISSSRVTSPPLKATLKPIGTATERPGEEKKQPTAPASEEEFGNTTDFSSSPTKETDHLGKPRFTGPHVRYIPKPDNKPCSITDSVRRFPTEEAIEGNATSPPQNPPTNLTVVTVEGCPSFVILDWEKPLNDTVTEYEVISRENGSFSGKNKSIQITNQTFSTVENLKPDTSYEFQVKPKNHLVRVPPATRWRSVLNQSDPRVSEPISAGRDAIWTERPFNSDSYSECKGKQYVKRTWYKKFVGVQLCNSLRYKIYLSDSLTGKFYNIGDQRGHGEDHCQFVDSFLDGRTGQQLTSDQLPTKEGYFRAVRQEPVQFGEIGGHTQINYVQWYECGTTIPGKW
ncbi:ABI family member 3-binding protein [Apodemus speciosus]|uniref:ABI family member 3-binding protein n=1 Tax=Apodemus speciosus TaxID=105296 RepID=A0ABQ0FM87_APOSI